MPGWPASHRAMTDAEPSSSLGPAAPRGPRPSRRRRARCAGRGPPPDLDGAGVAVERATAPPPPTTAAVPLDHEVEAQPPLPGERRHPAIQRSAAARSRASGTPVHRWISGSAQAATSAGRVRRGRQGAQRRRLAGPQRRVRAAGSPGADLGGDLASRPLTKRPLSSVENRLASSTVSLSTTAVGTSGG